MIWAKNCLEGCLSVSVADRPELRTKLVRLALDKYYTDV